jgi:hypothetical protein
LRGRLVFLIPSIVAVALVDVFLNVNFLSHVMQLVTAHNTHVYYLVFAVPVVICASLRCVLPVLACNELILLLPTTLINE